MGDLFCYLPLPMKNSESIPGPTWLPVNGSCIEIISSLGSAISLTIAASVSASSRQSPWLMATV